MNQDELRRWGKRALDELASAQAVDRSAPVFILGAYTPRDCKDLLVAVRDGLRSVGYLAFLEADLRLVASLQDSSRVLFDLASLNVFIATNRGISRGWQFEVADLARQSSAALRKMAFYYESYERLQGPVKDFLGNNFMLHEQIIRPKDIARTVQSVIQHVNTYFLRVRRGLPKPEA